MTSGLWKGAMSITVTKRPCRCKGDEHCDSYGVLKGGRGDEWKNSHGIPRGQPILIIDNGHEPPLIFCKTCMKKVFAEMRKVLAHSEVIT